MVDIRDGWLFGDINGVPVKRFPQPSYNALAQTKPNLVLHTTETAGYVESLQYPSQWQVGEGFIGQHRPVWAKGEALRGDTTNDPYAMQIEIVGFSQLSVWLPGPPSLRPLVELMAWLHRTGRVRTALRRPTSWPVRLDRGPQAVTSYYRRLEKLWPTTAGVYGHVEIPDNTHWDPGSLDYPKLFRMVEEVLYDMSFADFEDGQAAFLAGEPLDAMWSNAKKRGWRLEKRIAVAATLPEPTPSGAHSHQVMGTAT